MNKVFAEYATNTAFCLTLSKRQVERLLHIDAWPPAQLIAMPPPEFYGRNWTNGPDNWIASNRALEARGLIERVIVDPHRNEGYYKLTEAGRLTCMLLKEAGFKALSVTEKVA